MRAETLSVYLCPFYVLTPRWSERMGSIAPPVDDETKARVFFEHSGDDLYAIIGADLSELREALGSVSDRVEG